MNTEASTNEDVAAAVAAASAETPPAAPSAPSAPAAPATPRNPDGTFATRSPAAPEAPGDPSGTPAPTAATPTPGGQPGAAPAAGEAPAPGVPAAGQPGVVLDPSKPPQGWRPEVKEKWATIPEDIRSEIIRREEDSARGVERLRKFYEPMEKVYEVIAPHAQYFQHIQRNPQDYIHDVMQMEQTLTLGNPAQKLETVLAIGDRYGIPLRQIIDASMNGQLNAYLQKAHQMHGTPAPVPPQVQQELLRLRQLEAQQAEAAAEIQLNEFLSTNPPFFNEVGDQMEELLDSGVVKTYQEAYDLAVWRNPQLRARAQAIANGQQMSAGVQQRQAAAAAVSTPPPAPLSVPAATDEDDSVEGSLRAAMAKHARQGSV